MAENKKVPTFSAKLIIAFHNFVFRAQQGEATVFHTKQGTFLSPLAYKENLRSLIKQIRAECSIHEKNNGPEYLGGINDAVRVIESELDRATPEKQ